VADSLLERIDAKRKKGEKGVSPASGRMTIRGNSWGKRGTVLAGSGFRSGPKGGWVGITYLLLHQIEGQYRNQPGEGCGCLKINRKIPWNSSRPVAKKLKIFTFAKRLVSMSVKTERQQHPIYNGGDGLGERAPQH